MDAPQNWQQVTDLHYDQDWTEEAQGAGSDGPNWIFSCNANQSKPGARDKAIYVFKSGERLRDGNWIFTMAYKDVPHPISGLHESDDHWGQLTCYNGFVYVSHFWEGGPKQGKTNVVVFKNNGGFLEYQQWIELGPVADGRYPEFQAINPWDGKFYTCLGGVDVSEFFIHDPTDGRWTGEMLRLNGLLPRKVQGACFSDNGHLYVAVDSRFSDWGRQNKWIFYYSALNGTFLGKIPVIAEDDDHKLEGICYANAWPYSRRVQIHAVLLENIAIALDNIWLKGFSADRPEVV